MRRALGRIFRFVLAALALAAAGIAAAVIAAHTDWGREQLRRRVEAALGGAFPGGARVAALDGSVLGTLTLRGVELDGRDGRPLVTAGAVRARVALWPLAVRTARVDRLVSDDVHVVVRDQPPAPERAAAPSPWRVELRDVELHGAVVEIERARLALGELDASGAATLVAGRVLAHGAARGRWSRAGGPAVPLAATAELVLDGDVRIPTASVTLGGAAIRATALVLDADHPSGAIAITAPAAAIARLVPELGDLGDLGDLGGAVPGDLTAAIELAADGPATRLSVTATAGDARLLAALRGEPSRRTARGVVSATAIDLERATRGRLRGHGNVFAALDAGPDHARGAVIAVADLQAPDLPVRRAGVAIFGGLDGATALVLAGGDGGLRLAAAARAHRAPGAIVLDDARAVASTRTVTLPFDRELGANATDAARGGTRCRRITGELAVSARIAGTLARRPDLVVTGVAEGTGVTIELEAGGASCAALAAPCSPCGPGGAATTFTTAAGGAGPAVLPEVPESRGIRGAARVSIAALRSPFVLGVTPGGDGRADAGPGVAVTGDAAATALAYGDVTVAAARGTYALGVMPELRLDEAHLTAARVRRAGRLLGGARVEVERRGATYGVAATARPPIDGLIITTRAAVRRTGASYVAALGGSHVTLPDGAVWTGRGGSVTVSDPTDPSRLAVMLHGVTLHRGDAVVALSGDYAGRTGDLTARVAADRVDVSSIGASADARTDARTRGIGRGTLELARRGGRWQADGALAVAGLAASADAAPIDAAAHLALARGRAAFDVHATGPALGDIDLALDAAAPRDPFDLAAWRRLDHDAIRTAAITARHVALPALAGLVGRAARVPDGTIDGTVDLAPGALHGALSVRGVALPSGTLEGDVTLAPHDRDLDAHVTARLIGVAAADLTARFTVPRHPLDPATWQRRGRDLVRAASVKVGDLAFDPDLLARLGIAGRLAGHGLAAEYRGHARATLELGAAAGEARLAVDLTGVTGGALVAPVSQHLAIRAGPSGTHVRAELHAGAPGDELGLGVLEGDVPLTLDRWIDEPASVLRAPLTARWTLPATPLVAVLALFGRHELQAGTLEGAATIRGTVAAPIVPEARLVARDVVVAAPLGGRPPPAIQELEALATWGGASGTVTLRGREAAGGELHAQVSGRPGALAAATGTARMTRLDLAPIAALLPGALASVAGVVDGELALPRGGRLTGELHVTAGALPLAASIGTVRDATTDLTSDGRTVHARLHGRLGRGTLDLDADAAADLSTATARVTLDRASPIAALRPAITARATARLRREAGQLRGDVTVEPGGSVTLPEHAGTPLLDATVPSDLVLAGTPAAGLPGSGAPARPWLVLDVELGATRLIARALAEGLGFTGTLTSPSRSEPLPCGRSDRLRISVGDTLGVCGKLEIRSDDVEILGRRYLVEPTRNGPSSLVFDGTLDPRLDLRMSHPFSELTLNVDVRGRASKPEPRLSSDAAGYSSDELFGFLLGGEPSTAASSQTRDQAREAVAGAGTRLVSGKLGRQINRILPVKLDALSCEPAPGATTATSGSCTAGKWLSRRLYLAYRQRLQPRSDENTGDVQLQIRLGDRLLLEGTGGDRGYYGGDLIWRHRW